MAGKVLTALARPKLLHLSVQDSLKAFIAENGLAAGAPLPTEGDLAARLGVSRSSVREAIRGLESLGIVESRRGVGVFVADFSFRPLLDNLAFGMRGALREIAEVLQVRRALEVGLIGEAVGAMDDGGDAELAAVAERMRGKAERGVSFAEEDRVFHQALFRRLGNATLLGLIDVFWLAFFKAADDLTLENPDPMRTWRDHDAIVAAVRGRDAALARARLDEHYDGITRLLEIRRAETDRERTR